jgi:phage terminase small subunit
MARKGQNKGIKIPPRTYGNPPRKVQGKKRKKGISLKHLAVVNAYFANDFNAEEAMLQCGYAKTTARGNPHSVFDHPDVKAEIERRRNKMQEKHELTEDWVVKRLMQHGDSHNILAKFKKVDDEGGLFWDFTGATEAELAAISELVVEEKVLVGSEDAGIINRKTKIKGVDSKGALDSLARKLGMFKDSVELKGNVNLIERLHAGRDRVNRGPGT